MAPSTGRSLDGSSIGHAATSRLKSGFSLLDSVNVIAVGRHFAVSSRRARSTSRSTKSSASKQHSMAVLHDLIEAGKVTPVVGKTFPLAEAAQAIRYLAEGLAGGKIVLTV